MESVAEAEERVEILCWMLRDILQLSGEAIEDGKQLKEQLLTNFDELVATHLATEEVKRVWEEEKNQVSSSLAMLHTRRLSDWLKGSRGSIVMCDRSAEPQMLGPLVPRLRSTFDEVRRGLASTILEREEGPSLLRTFTGRTV
ncbi:hypothetical protein GW17_00038454 [Ensete ventricosum]|nr:hypothetical protein GW17_00038454 [Ensete ventricosum]